MRILVVGGGGREHSLVWKIAQSPLVKKIFCAPGNPGIAAKAECINIATDDIKKLKEFALLNNIDLTVVGPEAPLVKGIRDEFNRAGLRIFGPSKEAARIEGSKTFAKEVMRKFGVPTGDYRVFTEKEECLDYLKRNNPPFVLKADGLAAGKGVVIANDLTEAEAALENIMERKVFGDAGKRVIVEEYLTGPEVSVLCFCDGTNILPMVSAQDHKKAYDGDKGPNTGGMGAFSPALFYTDELHTEVISRVFHPVIKGLKEMGIEYKGVLYAGLIITDEGPKVLEFNCRFGDPETQAVLKRMESDLVEVMLAVENEKLDEVKLSWSPDAAVCVVLASGGYPNGYQKGKKISGLEAAQKEAVVFHAGTSYGENGEIVTSGGRVLGVTSSGKDIREAAINAYRAIEKINFENMHYRKDIGLK